MWGAIGDNIIEHENQAGWCDNQIQQFERHRKNNELSIVFQFTETVRSSISKICRAGVKSLSAEETDNKELFDNCLRVFLKEFSTATRAHKFKDGTTLKSIDCTTHGGWVNGCASPKECSKSIVYKPWSILMWFLFCLTAKGQRSCYNVILIDNKDAFIDFLDISVLQKHACETADKKKHFEFEEAFQCYLPHEELSTQISDAGEEAKQIRNDLTEQIRYPKILEEFRWELLWWISMYNKSFTLNNQKQKLIL